MLNPNEVHQLSLSWQIIHGNTTHPTESNLKETIATKSKQSSFTAFFQEYEYLKQADETIQLTCDLCINGVALKDFPEIKAKYQPSIGSMQPIFQVGQVYITQERVHLDDLLLLRGAFKKLLLVQDLSFLLTDVEESTTNQDHRLELDLDSAGFPWLMCRCGELQCGYFEIQVKKEAQGYSWSWQIDNYPARAFYFDATSYYQVFLPYLEYVESLKTHPSILAALEELKLMECLPNQRFRFYNQQGSYFLDNIDESVWESICCK